MSVQGLLGCVSVQGTTAACECARTAAVCDCAGHHWECAGPCCECWCNGGAAMSRPLCKD